LDKNVILQSCGKIALKPFILKEKKEGKSANKNNQE